MFKNLKNFVQNKLLRSHRENVNVRNKDGWTLLHKAVYKRKKKVAALLIKQNCDVNARIYDHSDKYPGYTALLLASQTYCDEEFVLMLINAGTDPEICNKKGETALQVCLYRRYSHEVIRQLLHNGACVNIKNTHGWTPLHKAALTANFEVIQSLLEFGSDVHARVDVNTDLSYCHEFLALDIIRMNRFYNIQGTRDGLKSVRIREGIKSMAILIKAGGCMEELQLKPPELDVMLKSNLIDLLIFSGTRIETLRSLSYDWELTSELYSKQHQQQQLKSLQRLAGDIVRKNLWPNALYGISKLPLPVALQRFVCFLDVKIRFDPDWDFDDLTVTYNQNV